MAQNLQKKVMINDNSFFKAGKELQKELIKKEKESEKRGSSKKDKEV